LKETGEQRVREKERKRKTSVRLGVGVRRFGFNPNRVLGNTGGLEAGLGP
jgi:hypothetical protein